MQSYGYRLDCQPYLGGALEAKMLLEKLPLRKVSLASVTKAIYHAGRESRLWVNTPEYGVPFLGAGHLRRADFSDLPLISRRQVQSTPLFIVHKRWTLITRSGTVGKMIYAREEMDGMAVSEDVLRVVPDEAEIHPGYLYAYLQSKFGVPLVVSGTYGAIIQHLEPEHIAALPVPRLGAKNELRIHDLIQAAADLRTSAAANKSAANQLFSKLASLPELKPLETYPTPYVGSARASQLADRMDTTYYVDPYTEARGALDTAGHGWPSRRLSEVADVFIPTIFKRMYADDPSQGYPYVTGADVFCIRPESSQYLMKVVAEENRLVLHRGMILLHEAGQRYGLIGRSVMVGRSLDGFACTNNMVRIVPKNPMDAGYLFAVLSSDYGLRLLKREAAGSSIPHLDERRIAAVTIPWPDENVRARIADPADRARAEWDRADELDAEADSKIVEALTSAVN